MAPRVSIIILSHRASLLPQAFDSVVAQTYRDREIVVKFFDGEWFPEKMNDAVRGTSGERFAFLCDDDRIAPTWIEKCSDAMDRDGTDIAYTNNEVFGLLPLKLALPDFSLDVVRLHCVPHFTALTSRNLFEKVGGYDGHMDHVDWDFWKRCADVGARASHVPDYLFQYRVGSTNESRNLTLDRLKAKHPDIGAMPDQRVQMA